MAHVDSWDHRAPVTIFDILRPTLVDGLTGESSCPISDCSVAFGEMEIDALFVVANNKKIPRLIPRAIHGRVTPAVGIRRPGREVPFFR